METVRKFAKTWAEEPESLSKDVIGGLSDADWSALMVRVIESLPSPGGDDEQVRRLDALARLIGLRAPLPDQPALIAMRQRFHMMVAWGLTARRRSLGQGTGCAHRPIPATTRSRCLLVRSGPGESVSAGGERLSSKDGVTQEETFWKGEGAHQKIPNIEGAATVVPPLQPGKLTQVSHRLR